MASGQFFGGIATGFQRQEAITNAANYQQGILQLEQQRLQQQTQRDIQKQIDDAKDALFKHINDDKTAPRGNGGAYDPKAGYMSISRNVDGLADLITKTQGQEMADIFRAQVAAAVNGPSPAAVESAMAQSKASATGELQLRQAEAAKNVASTRVLNQAADTNAVDNVNPDLDKSTQLGGEQKGDNFLHSLPGARGLNAKGLYEGTTPITAFSTRTGKNNTKSQRQQAVEDAEIYGQLIGKPFDINRAANLKISETAPAKADASTLTQLTQTRQALSAFEDTAKENIKVLLDLANKVPDTGAPILNRPIRALAKDALGNPDVGAFNFQLQSVKNELARIITNPRLVGQLTDNARNEINAALDDGATVGMITKAYQTAVKDFQNRSAGLDKSIQEVKDRLTGKPAKSEVPPPPHGFNVLGQ